MAVTKDDSTQGAVAPNQTTPPPKPPGASVIPNAKPGGPPLGGATPQPLAPNKVYTPPKGKPAPASTPAVTVPDNPKGKPVAGAGNAWMDGEGSAGTIRGEMASNFSPNMNLTEWGTNVANFWGQKVAGILGVEYSTPEIDSSVGPDMQGQASGVYRSGTDKIGLDERQVLSSLDSSVVVHELTHYLLSGDRTPAPPLKRMDPNTPEGMLANSEADLAESKNSLLRAEQQPHWLVEGIADWVPTQLGIATPALGRGSEPGEDPNAGYGGSSAFLDWLEQKSPGSVKALARSMHDNTYRNRSTPESLYGKDWGALMSEYNAGGRNSGLTDETLGMNDNLVSQWGEYVGVDEGSNLLMKQVQAIPILFGIQAGGMLSPYAEHIAQMVFQDAETKYGWDSEDYTYDEYVNDVLTYLNGPKENVDRLETRMQHQTPPTPGNTPLEIQRGRATGWQSEQDLRSKYPDSFLWWVTPYWGGVTNAGYQTQNEQGPALPTQVQRAENEQAGGSSYFGTSMQTGGGP